MDTPREVLVHNELVGMKGSPATLLQIHIRYYEVLCRLGDRRHRMLLPVEGTVLIDKDPQEEVGSMQEVER